MRRYASNNTIPGSVVYAWQTLGNSVYYVNRYGSHSLMLERPALNLGQGVSNSMIFLHRLEKG